MCCFSQFPVPALVLISITVDYFLLDLELFINDITGYIPFCVLLVLLNMFWGIFFCVIVCIKSFVLLYFC